MSRILFWPALLTYCWVSSNALAQGQGHKERLGVSHHGGVITNCTPPLFFEESPAKDAKVASFQDFSFTASDNTERDTLEVWINNVPTPVTVTEQRSGRLTVQGKLPQAISSGRVWVKVTGYSNDGCDQLHNWYVYTGR